MNYSKIKKEKMQYDYLTKKIDNILFSEENLEMYLDTIYNTKFEVAIDLQSKIIKNLKNNGSNLKDKIRINQNNNEFSNKSDKIFAVYDILKIVACTILTVGIWEVAIFKGEKTGNTSTVETANNKTQINQKISGFSEKVSNFFMSPIINERSKK